MSWRSVVGAKDGLHAMQTCRWGGRLQSALKASPESNHSQFGDPHERTHLKTMQMAREGSLRRSDRTGSPHLPTLAPLVILDFLGLSRWDGRSTVLLEIRDGRHGGTDRHMTIRALSAVCVFVCVFCACVLRMTQKNQQYLSQQRM